MRRHFLRLCIASSILLILGLNLASPGQPGKRPPRKPPNGNPTNPDDPVPEPPSPPAVLVADPKFQNVYNEFVSRAEKLAEEYEKTKQFDKAKASWEEIARLVPNYEKAKHMVEQYNQRETVAEKRSIDILANKDWQDTGVTVIPGKPIHITAKGTWTFTLSREITPDGIEIPKELRDYPLGALVGIIQTTDPKEMKAFVVGSEKSFVADKGGKLLLKMYHNNPIENKGKLSVDIQGTFEKSPK